MMLCAARFGRTSLKISHRKLPARVEAIISRERTGTSLPANAVSTRGKLLIVSIRLRNQPLPKPSWLHQRWLRCQQVITRSWTGHDKPSNDALDDSSHNCMSWRTSYPLRNLMNAVSCSRDFWDWEKLQPS